MFKDPKFHKNDQASKLTNCCEQFNRIVYKLFYFYLMPLLVIPVGLIGYTHDLGIRKVDPEQEGFGHNEDKDRKYEEYNWNNFLRSKSKHDIQDNVDGAYIREMHFNFIKSDTM